MRDQILTGIYTYLDRNDAETDAHALADCILGALGNDPTETPAVQFDAAHLVAFIAGNAHEQDSTADATPADEDDRLGDGHGTLIETLTRTLDHRDFRQFLFLVQYAFGVRLRETRLDPDHADTACTVIAGRPHSIAAFNMIASTFHGLGINVLADRSMQDKAAFWATLGGVLLARADSQVALNADNCQRAQETLNSHYGIARRLPRINAQCAGPVHEAALELLNDASTSLT